MTNTTNSPLAQMRDSLEQVNKPTRYVARPAISKIDPEALYRLSELKHFLPIAPSTWRKLVANQKAPQPIKLSAKCTLWRGSDVLTWLRNPDSYKA